MDKHTVDALFTLPGLPPHIELIDGLLVPSAPQTAFHSVTVDLLVAGLRGGIPPAFKVGRQMTVVVDRHNGPEPDISVIRADAVTGPGQMSYRAEDLHLAVEVVAPDTESRDRSVKPRMYAAAGIPHFWLVEMAGRDDHPVIQVYERGQASGTYVLTGIHHDHIKVDIPYPIDIDLTEIDKL